MNNILEKVNNIEEENSKLPFIPVQGTEEKILSNSNQALEGHIYFATDTKKIFLGKNNEFIPMCEKNTFFYGTKDVGWDNSGIAPSEEQLFSLTYDIEGVEIPEIDDLILNRDGCFYRIKNIEDDTITALRLTLQGSASGPSAGPNPSGGALSIQVLGNENKFFSTQAVSIPITIKGGYTGENENNIVRVVFKLKGINGEKDTIFYTHNEIIPFGVEKTIDLINYKHLFNTSASKTVIVEIIDFYDAPRSKEIKIKLIELKLDPEQSNTKNLFSVYGNSYNYKAYLAGGTSGVTNKKLIFNFKKEDSLDEINSQYRELSNSETNALYKDLDFTNFEHGIYTLRVRVEAIIDGTSDIITSNEIIHKFCVFKQEVSTPLLLISIPEKVEQYEDIPLDYLFVTGETIGKNYTLKIAIDNEELASLNCLSNRQLSDESYNPYYLYFEEQKNYSLTCEIIETGTKYEEFISVVPYTGKLPIIENSPELMLYLNPRGKSNEAIDRDIWKDYTGKSYTATLDRLQYGITNGWLKNDNKVSYLKLSQGATLKLKDFKPFSTDLSDNSGFTIELDFEVSGILDYSKPLISCLSQTELSSENKPDYGPGFTITGDKFKFYSQNLNDSLNEKGEPIGSLINLNLMEGKRTKIAFSVEPKSVGDFPLCYTYLNGILSQVAIYSKSDKFGGDIAYPATLSIDSTYADIKIYSIRFYSVERGSVNILNNYIASLDTANERKTKYAVNNISDERNENIDFLKVSAEDYNLQIPYMKLTGGYPTKELSKWELEDSFDKDGPRLPTGKKDYRLVDVEIVYPKTDLFNEDLGYKHFKFKNEFSSGEMKDNAGKKPTNGGCIMYGQGTSSMEYPVKNLRLRLKNEKFIVRPDIEPVEIICMKADYMESSGSHNTGAGNLIDEIYEKARIKTPGQEKFGPSDDNPDAKTIVTCIKGYPCLIFYSETGEEDSYKYIGKYNLNLDKATPEPFGFKHADDFGYLSPGDPYYKILYGDSEKNFTDAFIGQEKPAEGGDYVPEQSEELLEVIDGDKINSIHCFEFLDNAVEVCNFIGKRQLTKALNVTREEFNENKFKNYYILVDAANEKYDLAGPEFDENQIYYKNTPMSYEETWYGSFINSKGKTIPGWTLGFESRYPEDRVGYHDADMLYDLANWLNQLYLMRTEEEAAGLTPNDIIKELYYIRAEKYTMGKQYYVIVNGKYEEAFPTQDNFNETEYYIIDTVNSTERFAMTSLERFKREYQCYLNKEFLLAYYLITEVLLMADSRVKNMMIATWGREPRTYIDLDGISHEENHYIFYPIFYDMDTMLGLDNTGYNRFTYYSEDSDSSIYNGEEVLWNFVRDALKKELADFYDNRLDNALKISEVISKFNDNQANLANEIFYNEDAEYKYIRPAIEGYEDHLNEQIILPGVAPYLYALQGDRSLAREYFITNRLRYLQGKYKTNEFQTSDTIDFRWYYPTEQDSDPVIAESVKHVSPSSSFNFETLRVGFSGVKLGANGSVYSEKTSPNGMISIVLPQASGANGTEAYILGCSNLTSLGDLSDKYLQKFVLKVSDNRLKKLILGNPHQYYYNNKWQALGAAAQEITLQNCTHLEYFNLQNCSYNANLNFTKCPVISEILLTGSNVTSIQLPANGILKRLKLPSSITSLEILSHPYLSDFSIGGYEYGSEHKIDANDGGKYLNNYSGITELNIVNTPIDTYSIVKNSINLNKYNLQNINWEIIENDSFYCKKGIVGDDFTPEDGKVYYIYDASISHTYIEADINNQTHLTRNWFEKIMTVNSDMTITNVGVLEYLQTLSVGGGHTNHQTALSGVIKINIPHAIVDELQIYNKYIEIYPQIKIIYGNEINVNKAASINMYRKSIILQDENDTVNIDLSTEDFEQLEPYYNILLDGKNQVLSLILSDVNYRIPALSPEGSKEYEFTGRWIDYYTKNIYIQDNYEEKRKEGDFLFSEIIPSNNLYLLPIFIEKDRVFNIDLYDYNGSLIKRLQRKFGEPLDSKEGTAETVFLRYLYREDLDLAANNIRWALKGWKSQTDYNNQTPNPKLITDFAGQIINQDLRLYAHYIQENVQETISYFNSKDYDDYFAFKLFNNGIVNGYAISIKEMYRSVLKGAITLPINYKGQPIVVLDDFTNMFDVSEVYFYNINESQYKYLGRPRDSLQFTVKNSGFNCEVPAALSNTTAAQEKNKRKLKTIILPESITHIGDFCFTDNFNLKEIILPKKLEHIGERAFGRSDSNASLINQLKLQCQIEYLPETVKTIEAYAFYYGGPNITISQIPPEITELKSFTFTNCENLNIQYFGNWMGYPSKLQSIGPGCFKDAGNNITNIYFGNSLQNIALKSNNLSIQSSFLNYGASEGKFYDNTGLNLTTEQLGLKSGWYPGEQT